MSQFPQPRLDPPGEGSGGAEGQEVGGPPQPTSRGGSPFLFIVVKDTQHTFTTLPIFSAHFTGIKYTFSSSPTETLLHETQTPSPLPQPWHLHSTFCLRECDYSRDLVEVESCSICPFVAGSFTSILSSRFIPVAAQRRTPFLFRVNHIPLQGQTMFICHGHFLCFHLWLL